MIGGRLWRTKDVDLPTLAFEHRLSLSHVPPTRTRKPAISKEERLHALIASFSIEGIRITMEEALALLKKVELSPGEQNG